MASTDHELHEGPLEGRNLAIYMALGSLFITALVVCNLVSNKFVELDLGFKTFVISVGILPYPLTFLVTDLLSEFYGKRRTDYVVYSGFAALLLVLLVIWLGGLLPALPFSQVQDPAYDQVFGNSIRVIIASMAAYIVAQAFVGAQQLFDHALPGRRQHPGHPHPLRRRHSILVILILFVGVLPTPTLIQYIADAWIFKILMAALDTPFMYAGVWAYKRMVRG
ncbi:MAG: hypothetical protein RL104_1123 [Bacteroidota bacterium]